MMEAFPADLLVGLDGAVMVRGWCGDGAVMVQ